MFINNRFVFELNIMYFILCAIGNMQQYEYLFQLTARCAINYNKSYLFITHYVCHYVYKYGYSRKVSGVSCCTEAVSLVLTLPQIECGKLLHTDWLLERGFLIGGQKNHKCQVLM